MEKTAVFLVGQSCVCRVCVKSERLCVVFPLQTTFITFLFLFLLILLLLLPFILRHLTASSSPSRLVLHSHPDSEAIPIRSWHRLLHHDVMLSEWPGPSSRWHSPRPLLPPSPRSVTSHVTVPRRRQLPVVQNFVITPVVTTGTTGLE